jgi:phosphoserine phosphatase RsbU/P
MDDLHLAAKVHYSFLPKDYEDERISIAVTLCPLYPIGGDYCSINPLNEDLILLCMCDALGHGTPAALFAARINTYVLTHAKAGIKPCEIVSGLNSYLCKRLSGVGMYATFFAVLLDLKQGIMSFAGAAHPPVLHLDNNQPCCREWPSIVSLLGMMDPMPLICETDQAQLKSGDHILLYSDGLVEVEDANQQPFGIGNLAKSLITHRDLSGQALNKAILNQAESFGNSGFQDDVLLLSAVIK